MNRSDFYFDLPDTLIARYPLERRTSSRLLRLDAGTGAVEHGSFEDNLDLVQPQDLLVFNDTRVIPARLFGSKASGGRVEILVERLQSEYQALAHIKASNKTPAGSVINLGDAFQVTVTGRQDALYCIMSETPLAEIMEALGHMPLPPYIDRPDEAMDAERYQTVYAREPGAVAAPTAGLHFSNELLAQLEAKGVETGFVTLHVGAGTFQPVRVDNIRDHQMHSEWFQLDADLVERIKDTKARGGRVIAVGTTAVRTLESAARDGELKAMQGETDIFIYPGYRFQVVDAMLTNFHLPESTLIMLVSAFAGRDHVLKAYQEAIAKEYRFFSYGDAMFISGTPSQGEHHGI